MFETLANYFSSFILGLLTPLSAVCVLPLYPGFLTYLSSQVNSKHKPIIFGFFVNLGIIAFMSIIGFIFTTILQVSLTKVTDIISPIAFGIMGIISILLIFNVDFGKIFPHVNTPTAKNPILSAFLFGFFFGAIVIPCNPGFIGVFFTKSIATSTGSFLINMLNFFFFALGIGFPLLVFSAISTAKSRLIIGFLTKHKTIINRISGVAMLIISIYYLIFVFKIISF